MLVTSWRFTIFDICKINCILRTRVREEKKLKNGLERSWVIITGTWQNCESLAFTFSSNGCQKYRNYHEINFQQQRRAGFRELKSADCIVYLSTAAC
jgi:hypothetical protein